MPTISELKFYLERWIIRHEKRRKKGREEGKKRGRGEKKLEMNKFHEKIKVENKGNWEYVVVVL